MIKPAILTALNDQIQHELSNACAYQALAVYFDQMALHGFEAFMGRRSVEERTHATRLIRHLATRRGVRADPIAISAAKREFASPQEALVALRDWERATTTNIYRLFDLAREGDIALEVLLHGFIAEQVDVEAWSGELSERASWCQPGELFTLDHQWSQRMESLS